MATTWKDGYYVCIYLLCVTLWIDMCTYVCTKKITSSTGCHIVPEMYEVLVLSNEEVVEILWPYLHRFSCMSKEMRSSQWLDITCDALYQYCVENLMII